MCSCDSVEIALVLGLWCAGTQMARWQQDGLARARHVLMHHAAALRW